MVEIYDDHEQSERVRQWIKENGSAIVMGVVLAIGGLYGWKFWQNQQTESRVEAAAEYQGLVMALDQNLFDQAYSNFETIKSDFPKSMYNPMAHLMIAAARFNQGQPDLAVSLYREILNFGGDSDGFVQVIAAERLARLLLDQGDIVAAEEVLKAYSDNQIFATRIAEVQGDILTAKGDVDGARAAYQQALDSMAAGTGDRRILELKRDNPVVITDAEES